MVKYVNKTFTQNYKVNLVIIDIIKMRNREFKSFSLKKLKINIY